MDFPKRGELWFISLEPVVRHKIGKTRPALIISNDKNNLYSEIITVLPITSTIEKIYPFEILLSNKETHLPKDSKVKCNQIRTVDKKRLINLVCTLLPEKLEMIEKAILIHLDIDEV